MERGESGHCLAQGHAATRKQHLSMPLERGFAPTWERSGWSQETFVEEVMSGL